MPFGEQVVHRVTSIFKCQVKISMLMLSLLSLNRFIISHMDFEITSSLPLKIKYLSKCVSYFATSVSVVAAILLIMAKLSVTLRFVCLSIWESLNVQVKIFKSSKNYAA